MSEETKRRRLPLGGVRVADFSWIVAGPQCTQLLALLGAEVIRVESNTHSDVVRRIPPYPEGKPGPNRGGLFHALNCNKKSCNIDLNHSRAIEVVKRLILVSDVVTENFSYGMMERFGLGLEELRRMKPDLVVLTSSGYGRTGPYKKHVAWGPVLPSYAGLCSLTGYEDGAPQLVNGIWGDHLTGTMQAFVIMAALHRRAKTGEGCLIDISMCETIAAHIPEALIDYTMNGRVAGRENNTDAAMAPHGAYPCQGDDKWVAIAVEGDEEWRAFCQATGHPEWAEDARFADGYRRLQNRRLLDEMVSSWTREHTPYEATEILQRAGVAAAPSLNMAELLYDPHLQAREFFVTPQQPETGARPMPGLPWRATGNPGGLDPEYRPAPLLGEHTEYVLRDLLGYSDEEIVDLVAGGVIN